MKGRPIEFSRQDAIAAALDVFWRQGYEKTSMQELLSAMNLSKSSLYQAFGSKQQLFEICLTDFRERQARRMRRALDAAPSGLSFVQTFLLALAEEKQDRGHPKGCLVMNTATEFAGRNAPIADSVQQGIGQFVDVFRSAVERAQNEGDIPVDRDADVLARYIVSTVSGLKTMVKAGTPQQTVESIVRVALRALT